MSRHAWKRSFASNWGNSMHNWERITLGVICESSGGGIQTGPFGSQLHASDYVQDGTPSVMPQNIGDNRIDPTGIARVSASDIARLSRYTLRAGDIVYSRRGDVERRALVRTENEGWLCGTGCLRVRIGDQSRYDSRFVSYALGLPESRKWIKRHAVGATMLNLNTSILSAVPLLVPSLSEQRAIAEALEALDNKIAANEKVSSISQELARSIFARATRLGGKATIRSIVKLVARGITPKYVESDGVVVLNQKCVRDQRINLTPSRMTQESSVRTEKLLRRDDVLVNSTGAGTLGRIARWAQDIRATVDSHITIVRFDSDLVDPVCAGFGLLQIEKEVEGLAEGSTGQTELRRDLLAGLEIDVPDKAQQGAVGAELSALDELSLGLQQESDRLAAARDELLPLLMSGKICVREAEKAVEGVV
ncbi:restriction endonuclease subunit S [Prauserella muralis]|uniref:restriction endonuclease subunit S n=2 Tax=Prauserella muralis TaxID=588067 RepID=UPI0011ABFD7C|nr:type I restriction enzyme S subunit [Prauserella muralis]